jgi:arginyl-tRNA--protein-N-Asp/Glu arginylyltransferase
MGKKSAHSGESPKDRSINIMDKFITRNTNRERNNPVKTGRRKDPNIPVNLWPLKDQIEYWASRTDADRFDEQYPVYSYWITEVQKKSGVYPTTFTDFTKKLKPHLQEMFENKTSVRDAVSELRKHGVY